MKNGIKVILFDMDGVLIDAREWHYEALNKALSVFGAQISRNDHLNIYDGLPTRIKLEKLTSKGLLPTELHDLINKLKQKYTLQYIYQYCSPTFNHQFALSKLKSDGFKIGLCSNSIRKSIDVMMNLSSLDQYLDGIWSAENVKKGKPDPEIYNISINHFNVDPKEVLIVEDNENGFQAAKGSGAHCLLVKDPTEVKYQTIVKKLTEINAK